MKIRLLLIVSLVTLLTGGSGCSEAQKAPDDRKVNAWHPSVQMNIAWKRLSQEYHLSFLV